MLIISSEEINRFDRILRVETSTGQMLYGPWEGKIPTIEGYFLEWFDHIIWFIY
jgi:hypothetical protein